MHSAELDAIAERTREIYERNAARFDRERHKILVERKWLERFLARIGPGARLLDAGCGAGEPIARHLIDSGYAVTGVDFSHAMLDICRARFPGQRWIEADMRELSLGETFDGIIAWHSFFHLRMDEQRSTLVRFADHLAPGGVLMLTVGPEAGEVTGHVGDDVVYHASLSPSEYENLLREHGVEVVEFVAEDDECDGATVLLAVKAT